jgi:SAM-dependent methyltransferase
MEQLDMQTVRTDTLRQQILHDYDSLEPAQSDTWNPVHSDHELAYRMSMLYALTRSLRLCEIKLHALNVLDVGSGNGRSTRIYIDLGLRPEQLVSVDFRTGAIDLARSLHPTIAYRTCDSDRIDTPDGTFNWVQAATVFSSIADHADRATVAREMIRNVAPGGYIFYFDLRRANWFAGHDVIDVETLFSDMTILWSSGLRAHRTFPRVRRPPGALVRRAANESRWARFKREFRPRTRLDGLLHQSHHVLLARK